MTIQHFGEGDVFALPLRDRGWALGVLTRHDDSVGVGYFFGPRLNEIPSSLPLLTPGRPLVIERFGDLGFCEGDWRILGRLPNWDSKAWPIPPFGRFDVSQRKAWRVHYRDHDLVTPARREAISVDELAHLPQDVLAGAGAVERRLTALLGPSSDDVPDGPIAHIRHLNWEAIVRDASEGN